MSLAAVATAAVTVILALTGYIATYFTGIATAQVAARLARINSQLSDLYGPLLAELEAGNAAWRAFTDEAGGEDKTFWCKREAPTEAEAALWIEWITKIFQPRNQRMIDRLMAHSDLLNEASMDPCLVALAANAAVYEVMATRWTKKGFKGKRYEDYVAPSEYRFPREQLDEYLGNNFSELKHTQQLLLKSYRSRVAGLAVARQNRKPPAAPGEAVEEHTGATL